MRDDERRVDLSALDLLQQGSAVTLDINILLFTLGVSILTGILFGLVPAISATRPNLAAVLNENGSRSGLGFRSGKLRSALVIGETLLRDELQGLHSRQHARHARAGDGADVGNLPWLHWAVFSKRANHAPLLFS